MWPECAVSCSESGLGAALAGTLVPAVGRVVGGSREGPGGERQTYLGGQAVLGSQETVGFLFFF